jgi:D-lactate dehydratase
VIEAVSKVGADHSSPMGPFDDYSITAGRVTTGTNPASARSAAERAVKVFERVEKAAPSGRDAWGSVPRVETLG